MYNCKEDMFEFMSNYISKSDVYAANVIAKVSMFIYKRRQELQMTQKEFAEMIKEIRKIGRYMHIRRR